MHRTHSSSKHITNSSLTPISTSKIVYQILNERPSRKNRLRRSSKRGKSMENLNNSKMTDASFPKIYKNHNKIKCKKCVKFSYLFEKALIE
ncbi:unnamed protein product [Blepharisma stoltei]|uniref:Uncharacterized protein n=1 Tax=Blepharisma stoltei TaxID=1481888 RepID=A0AAU9IAK7_9CILI|nr:unnamed protein product [Blepharisma stoltei]